MDVVTLASTLGLSVPLTLVALGALHFTGAAPDFVETAVARYPLLVSPLVLGLGLLLFVFEVAFSKSKFTKALKAPWDALQFVIKPVASAMLSLAIIDARITLPATIEPVALAGFGTSSLTSGWTVVLAVVVTLLVHVVRTGADLLVWFSPIPTLDAIVSTLADLYSLAMVALVFLFPSVAAIACVIQLALSAMFFGSMWRVLVAVSHLVVGRLWPATVEREPPSFVVTLPGGRAARACWVTGGPGGRWQSTWAWVWDGQLHFASRRLWRWRTSTHAVGSPTWLSVSKGLLAVELQVMNGRTPLSLLWRLDCESHADALVGALARAGVEVDDARPGGERLPAARRALVS